MFVKLLKLNAKLMTNKGATETINKGKVIFINCFHLDAPSITAASYRSSGILCKDPK
jgi:hypothetical protein